MTPEAMARPMTNILTEQVPVRISRPPQQQNLPRLTPSTPCHMGTGTEYPGKGASPATTSQTGQPVKNRILDAVTAAPA